jgi:hypothetical protein
MRRLPPVLTFVALAGPLLLTTTTRAEDTGPPLESLIYFSVPAPNLYFEEAPALLTAEITVEDGTLDMIMSVELFVDDVSVGVQDCLAACSFPDIELGLGVHEFVAVADTGATAGPRNVYVGEEPPSDTESGGDGDGDGNDEASGDTAEGDSAKGCSVGASTTPSGLMAVPLLMLLGLRRRE